MASLAACALRFLSHLLSGAVVWYEITKAGEWNDLVMRTGMWTYSTIYNATYMVPEAVITVVASPAIAFVLAAVESAGLPPKPQNNCHRRRRVSAPCRRRFFILWGQDE